MFVATVAEVGYDVPSWVTGFYLVILVAMVLCLAFEDKIHAKKSNTAFDLSHRFWS